MSKPRPIKVKGINLRSGFWYIIRIDTSTGKAVLRNKRDQSMIIPLARIEQMELIEKRIKV